MLLCASITSVDNAKTNSTYAYVFCVYYKKNGEIQMDIKLYKLDENSEILNLLKLIKKFGTVTRNQIVNFTGYSSAKISLLMKNLEDQGLIDTVGEDESTGGRKAKLIQLKGSKGHFVGIELGGYEQKISLIDFNGRIIAKDKIPENTSDHDQSIVIGAILKFIRNFINTNESYSGNIKGIGLAISGIVDYNTGICRYFRNKKSWEGINLGKILEDEFSLPCVIDDSSRMMAVAEMNYGSCKEVDNFILFSIGVGLGTGIVINRRVFRGNDGLAGEIGHMVIKENGPRCVCGNYGCLESFVSGYAIERQLQKAINDNVYSNIKGGTFATAKEVIQQAIQGDKLAYSIVGDVAENLGIGISNTINIFNPQLVILAGGISNAGNLLLGPVEQVIKASALEYSARNCRIVISGLDEYSASMGIANLCIDRLLEDDKALDLLLK